MSDEGRERKRLREDVCDLLCCGSPDQHDGAAEHLLTKEVMLHVDVLAALVVAVLHRDAHGSLVVHQQPSGLDLRASEVLEQLAQVHDALCCVRARDVLRLCAALRNDGLPLGAPFDGASCEHEHGASSGATRFHAVRPAGI